jgi:hypothetical protein
MIPNLRIGLLKIFVPLKRKRLALKNNLRMTNKKREVVPQKLLLSPLPKIILRNGYLRRFQDLNLIDKNLR